MTELVPVPQSIPATPDDLRRHVERLKREINEREPIDALITASDTDALRQILASRGWAMDELRPLAELKLTAERRIGRARLQVPRHIRTGSGNEPNPLKKFDTELGIQYATAVKWQTFASIPDRQWEQILNETEELSSGTVMWRVRKEISRLAKRVAPGVYQRPNGLLEIRWRHNGHDYRETLHTQSIARAQTILKRRRLGKKESAPSEFKSAVLDRAYEQTRRSLNSLDKLLADNPGTARPAVLAAITALHAAEDALLDALKAWTIRKDAA